MWLVRLALRRPYTFVILSLLIFILGVSSIVTTPVDILPEINIPIVSVIWTYNGLAADDMSKRIVGICERALSTTVNNIKSTESQSYNGVGVIKVSFQPNVQIDLAIAQVTALAQSILRQMPPGILPPQILKYDASSVPILQLSLGGTGLSQQQLFDLGRTSSVRSWPRSRARPCRCRMAGRCEQLWWMPNRSSWPPSISPSPTFQARSAIKT